MSHEKNIKVDNKPDTFSLFENENLSRDELLQRLKNKQNEIKNKTNRMPKKDVKKLNDLLKVESKNKLVNENIMNYYLTYVEKNKHDSSKKLLTPTELINSNNSDFILTTEIIELYYLNKLTFDKMDTPLPHEIYMNKKLFSNTYNDFLNNFLNKIKELPEEQKIKEIKFLFDNCYCKYMTKCLGISINPFENTN
jgi:hypothetical protein